MCIMEVRPGQRSSTIAQAMAHNLSTIERDLDMFKPLLEARGETELLATVQAGHEAMKVAYASFLDCFIHEIQHEVAHGHGDAHDTHVGNERVHAHVHSPADQEQIDDILTLLQPVDVDEARSVAEAAAASAERYETR